MLSVQPLAPSKPAAPKRALTTARVGVEPTGMAIQVQPPRPAMDWDRAARSVVASQDASVSAVDGAQLDSWGSVLRKVVRKASGLSGEAAADSVPASRDGAKRPAALAKLLRSRKVKNLVRQTVVAREWSSAADKPSMVMEQWVRTAALRSEQQQQPRRRRHRTTSASGRAEEGDGEGDGDGAELVAAGGGSDEDARSRSPSSSSSSSSSSRAAEGGDEDKEDEDEDGDSRGLRRAPDALRMTKHAYSRQLLLEESCRRALAQSGDRRSDADVQALRSWLLTTKLKISTELDKLPPAQLDALCRRMTSVALAPGDVVFRQGDAGDALYVVLSGTVEVRVGQRVLGEQVEVTACELARGDYFGERALLSNDARAATVVATSSSELVQISRADYDQTLRNDQLEFLSRMQLSAGGSALAGLPGLMQQSQREYLRILGTPKHARSKADVALLAEYLQTLKFFRPLPPAFVRELCVVVDLACLSAGDVVFREGEVGDLFYIIFSGSIDVLAGAAAGPKPSGAAAPHAQAAASTKLVNLTEGAHFGELALMKGRGVRSATVVAREESKLLVICEKDYNATLRRLQKRDLARRAAALARMALFQTPEWTAERLRELSYVLVDHKLATGAELFAQGDKAQHVYFVVRGELVAERTLVNPLASASPRGAKASAASAPPTTTAVVERISRFRVIGNEAAAGATFKEPTFREVTVTASTPVELLVLSKYDVFHRLPPAMRDALGRGSSSSGYGASAGDGPSVEPVVYVDRFVKSAKWDAAKRRVVDAHVDRERVATRLAATARAAHGALGGGGNQQAEAPSPASARRARVHGSSRPLVDANELLLVPSARDAAARSFVRADCAAGYASLARFVTRFNADAPPSRARRQQLRDALAAERRRGANVRNEGNPLAYFDADAVRRQHRLQLQASQPDEREARSQPSSARRLVPVEEEREARVGGAASLDASMTASMRQCLQENYICSPPVAPESRAAWTRARRSQASSAHREGSSSGKTDADASGGGGDGGGDGDLVVVRFQFARQGASEGSCSAAAPSEVATAFQILQSARSPAEAADAARAFLASSREASADVAGVDGSDGRAATGVFVVPKKRFALPPGVSKAREQRLQAHMLERFGRWPAAASSTHDDDGSRDCSDPCKPSPGSPAPSDTTSSSMSAASGGSWSRGLVLFASFDELPSVCPSPSPSPSSSPSMVDEERSREACASRASAKAFAVASVVLSRREIVNGSSDEPLLCIHGVFASEAAAMDAALRLGPPPLRSALICVLPARCWVRFEDAYEWCVQVEPDRREKRAPSSTLVVSPNRNKPPSRPVLGRGASFKASIGPALGLLGSEHLEAARLHQFICARMGVPRHPGGDDSGFTPKPVASLEDKLTALKEYLDVSSNVAANRSLGLAAAVPNASVSVVAGRASVASSAGDEVGRMAGGGADWGGSRLLGRVRQVKRFGSILRSRVQRHEAPATAAKSAPFSPSRTSISGAKRGSTSSHTRRATDTIL